MQCKNELNVGLIGMGCIGQGVMELIKANTKTIKERTGLAISLTKVCNRKSNVNTHGFTHTNDYREIVNDKNINTIIELVGGTEFAYKLVKESLQNAKNVVTANKALLAKHGKELKKISIENNVQLLYDASVGGGIPIIDSLQHSLNANEIIKIYGILNGTSNYILTKMEHEGLDFKTALKNAQKLGFAEPDPHFDISGKDCAHKALVLCQTVYNTFIEESEILIEGIENISNLDFEMARELGYTIKHLGIIEKSKNKLNVRAHPVMIKSDSLLSNVSNEMNAIHVEGDFIGPSLYYGKGAGPKPTASSVVSDVIKSAKNICHYITQRKPLELSKEIKAMYYINVKVEDKPGVLASITKVLGDNGISISSAIQKRRGEKYVPIILMTHNTKESLIKKSIEEISELNSIQSKAKAIRVLNVE